MYGNYVIDQGDYLFTLKNIINKKFDIVQGSTIKWNGLPYKADLAINTIYKTRALLSPLVDTTNASSSDFQSINLKKRYPINLILLLSGELLEPSITFGVDIPTINSASKQTILSSLNE
jgi:hypothetical protein